MQVSHVSCVVVRTLLILIVSNLCDPPTEHSSPCCFVRPMLRAPYVPGTAMVLLCTAICQALFLSQILQGSHIDYQLIRMSLLLCWWGLLPCFTASAFLVSVLLAYCNISIAAQFRWETRAQEPECFGKFLLLEIELSESKHQYCTLQAFSNANRVSYLENSLQRHCVTTRQGHEPWHDSTLAWQQCTTTWPHHSVTYWYLLDQNMTPSWHGNIILAYHDAVACNDCLPWLGQEWARDEALVRNVREAKGLPIEYGKIYSQEPRYSFTPAGDDDEEDDDDDDDDEEDEEDE